MKAVKIIRPAKGFVIGQTYGDEVTEGQRQTLVECGRAVWVEPAAVATETPAEQPAVSRGGRNRR